MKCKATGKKTGQIRVVQRRLGFARQFWKILLLEIPLSPRGATNTIAAALDPTLSTS